MYNYCLNVMNEMSAMVMPMHTVGLPLSYFF